MIMKIMRSLFLITFIYFSTYSTYSQSPNQIIKMRTNPNMRYLEHLIKDKIDSMRLKAKIHPLANDSAMYLASKDHAEYLSKVNKVTHHQIIEGKETPQKRIELYGGSHDKIHEFLGVAYVHIPIKNISENKKSPAQITLQTYGSVANYLLKKWSKDAGVMAQFLSNSNFTIGLSAKLNKLSNEVHLVGIIGRPYLKFSFTENKKMFPYSKFVMYDQISSFKDVKGVDNVDMPYDLKEPSSPSQCEECLNTIEKSKFNIYEKNGNVFVSSRDISSLKSLFSSDKNGLMLEYVIYDTYHWGNPEYYTKPSRRNKKYFFNGEVLKPKYGNALKNGFDDKKGKFKILLGKLPKIESYYELNLWVIYNKKPCKLIRNHTVEGDHLALYQNIDLRYDFPVDTFEFKPNTDTISFSYLFNDGLYEFNSTNARTLKHAIESHTGHAKYKIEVTSYVPVVDYTYEPKDVNRATRAIKDSIVSVLGKKANIFFSKEYDWKSFNFMINDTEDSIYLNQERKSIRSAFKNYDKKKKYGKKLATHWHTDVEVVFYHDTLAELFQDFKNSLDKLNTTENLDRNEVHRVELLQKYLFEYADTNHVDPKSLIKINKIVHKPQLAKIMNNQAVFEYTHIWQKDHNQEILDDFYDLTKYTALEVNNPSPIHMYNHLAFSINHWTSTTYDKSFKSNKIKAELLTLEKQGYVKKSDPIHAAFDLKAVFYYYKHRSNSKAAELYKKTLAEIKEIYGIKKGVDTSIALCKTLIYYGKKEEALEIIQPFVQELKPNDKALELYYLLEFKHVPVNTKNLDDNFYDNLVKSGDIMNSDVWCNMFVTPSKISFQAFDYEPLHTKYCEKCSQKQNHATMLLKKK